jgi:hypothetical protein
MRLPRTKTHPGDTILSLFPSYNRAAFSTSVFVYLGWAETAVSVTTRRRMAALRFSGITANDTVFILP